MALPLMPKATAVWLVENTSLTFDQIGEFCGLHPLEVQAIADGEVAVQMQGLDPIANGQLTLDEIARGQKDPAYRLKLSAEAVPVPVVKHRGPRYTPIAKRQDKPDAIAWLLKSHPELSDGQISKLIGTTKPTIQAVRDRTHWNSPNIKPRHPVAVGLCTLAELDAAVARANRGKKPAETASAEADAAAEPLGAGADDSAS
ncbi:MAG TPA: cell cycle transcriptional regulator TrcR [Stellaceae bacterium]